jgi:hypothetical protein
MSFFNDVFQRRFVMTFFKCRIAKLNCWPERIALLSDASSTFKMSRLLVERQPADRHCPYFDRSLDGSCNLARLSLVPAKALLT